MQDALVPDWIGPGR